MEPKYYPSLTQPQRRDLRGRYIKSQNGLCYFCGDSLDGPPGEKARKRVRWSLFPPTFQVHPVHLHHSHDTGMTIGAVHMKCNAVLWQYYGE